MDELTPHVTSLLAAADKLTTLISDKSLGIITSLKYMAKPLERLSESLTEAVSHAPEARIAGAGIAAVGAAIAAGGALIGHLRHGSPQALQQKTEPLSK